MSIENCEHCGHPRNRSKVIPYRMIAEAITECEGNADETDFPYERNPMNIIPLVG